MDITTPITSSRPGSPVRYAGWAALALFAVAIAFFTIAPLWPTWRSDKSLSHGPLVPLVTAGLIYARREQLRDWSAASLAGLLLLVFTTLVHILAVWGDIAFLKPLSMIGMIAGGIWFLGGWKAISATAGALGFLIYMIPWPTLLVDKIAFPLQLMSSTYATLLGGILGLPLVRDGVQVAVLPDPEKPPVYAVIVAQECSGLTSLMVLLALGYLAAYFTPARLGWRALMLASVVPLALLCNAVRVTAILWFGANVSKEMAMWVHDNEAPVLIFFCTLGLMAFRQVLLNWLQHRAEAHSESEGETRVPVPVAHN